MKEGICADCLKNHYGLYSQTHCSCECHYEWSNGERITLGYMRALRLACPKIGIIINPYAPNQDK